MARRFVRSHTPRRAPAGIVAAGFSVVFASLSSCAPSSGVGPSAAGSAPEQGGGINATAGGAGGAGSTPVITTGGSAPVISGGTGNAPSSGGSGAVTACATENTEAEPAPLDIYVMLDSSLSMLDLTPSGVSKWDAVR